ncbi:tyrosine-protein phosphatase non-receptor type 23-like [Adelges cooleyi]|uniref:tyrosine-protein phosphatase non-receptor type 23-like n=1 Tax=Adelges cooleyi TaxID=133065 RepID=UPI0021802B0C|nr:tyrosine-protein phosphatase non-receptor type 23-like [Adelges cooleyi]
MEAVPRLYMISFPLKISQQSPDFTTKINHHIHTIYDQDPTKYNDDLSTLLALRETSVDPSMNVEGCSILKRYFCQLHALKSRFPMAENGNASVVFSWNHLFNQNITYNMSDITLEMVSILYNIGALHCRLGAIQDRTSDDEALKMACTHFQCAAWAFQELNDNYPGNFRPDLSSDLLQYMYQLCLAQAQECILEKSMMDNRKSLIIAKVSAKISEYYNGAMNALVNFATVDSIGESVGMKRYKMWSKYCMFKKTYYECVTAHFQGQHAEDQQQMGFRVSYYQIALNKLEEAVNQSKHFDEPEQVQDALTFTMDVVAAKWKASKTENELIYHENVPSPVEEDKRLEKLKGASLVKSIGFSVSDPEISGPSLFADLVPTAYQKASNLYTEEKNKLLQSITEIIEQANNELSKFSSSLQLDCLDESIWKVQTPQSLINSCAAFQAHPEKLSNLLDLMNKLTSINEDIKKMLLEINRHLKTEEIEDKIYQDSVGQPYNSIVICELTREAAKYEEAHMKAEESNETLHIALEMHTNNFKLMNLSLEELEKHLPPMCCPNNLDENDKKLFSKLQSVVNKLCEMQSQREMLASQFHKAINEDNLSLVQVTQSQNDLSTLFKQQISTKYANLINIIKQNITAQTAIIEAVRVAYMQAAPVRKLFVSSAEKRREKINSLLESFNCMEDLIEKSSKGLDFYHKLSVNVSKLLQRVKGTCQVQTEERDQIMMNTASDDDARPQLQNKLTTDAFNYYQPSMNNAKDTTNIAHDSYYNGLRRPSPLGSEQVVAGYSQPKEYLSNLSTNTMYSNLTPRMSNLDLNNVGSQTSQVSQSNSQHQPQNVISSHQSATANMNSLNQTVNTIPSSSSLSSLNYTYSNPTLQGQTTIYSYPLQAGVDNTQQQNNLGPLNYTKTSGEDYIPKHFLSPGTSQIHSSSAIFPPTNTNHIYNTTIPLHSRTSLGNLMPVKYSPSVSLPSVSPQLSYGNGYAVQTDQKRVFNYYYNNTIVPPQTANSSPSNVHGYNTNPLTGLYCQSYSSPAPAQGSPMLANPNSSIVPNDRNMANYNQYGNSSVMQPQQGMVNPNESGTNYYQTSINTNVNDPYYSIPSNNYHQNYTTHNSVGYYPPTNLQNYPPSNYQVPQTTATTTTSLLDDMDSHMVHAPPPLILPQKVSNITKTEQ